MSPIGTSQVVWRKSTRSTSQGGNCVEIGVTDRPHVTSNEVDSDARYLVRDSKNPEGPVLAFNPAEWDVFIRGIKTGQFNA